MIKLLKDNRFSSSLLDGFKSITGYQFHRNQLIAIIYSTLYVWLLWNIKSKIQLEGRVHVLFWTVMGELPSPKAPVRGFRILRKSRRLVHLALEEKNHVKNVKFPLILTLIFNLTLSGLLLFTNCTYGPINMSRRHSSFRHSKGRHT